MNYKQEEPGTGLRYGVYTTIFPYSLVYDNLPIIKPSIPYFCKKSKLSKSVQNARTTCLVTSPRWLDALSALEVRFGQPLYVV